MIPRLPKGFTHPMAIGQGSFSSVYRVRQSALDRWVAIKVISEKSAPRREDLLKEAKKQAQLPLAGIPAIYDAFEWRQQVCIVMQWIHGVTLESLLEKGIPPVHRGPLAAAVLAALAGLHRLGYAHRDLKPANILVSPSEGIHLVDFGFARRIDAPDQSLAGAIIGTPLYMAPELWKSGDVDLMRADLYALGRILKRVEPGNAWDTSLEAMLQEDPARRPASAVEAWRDREDSPAPEGPCDWKALAGPAAADHHARQLLQAAKLLLYAGREEEAYWLGIESLESDPDSAEAVRLLDQVPHVSRRKARVRRLWKAALAAGFVLSVAGGFLLGRQAAPSRIAPAPGHAAKALLLPGKAGPRAAAPALHLRELAGKGGLAGRLSVAGTCDSLRVDGDRVAAEPASAGIAVLAGAHHAACLCEDGIRRERFEILPFQSKVLRLCPPAGEGES